MVRRFTNVSWEENDGRCRDFCEDEFKPWIPKLKKIQMFSDIKALFTQLSIGQDYIKAEYPYKEEYRTWYHVHFRNSSDYIIQFSQPVYTQDVTQRLHSEIATMRYLAHNTPIPLPAVPHHGPVEQAPGNLGPFVIMEWVDSKNKAQEVLCMPKKRRYSPITLNPDIDQATLTHVYGQMAEVLLHLYKCKFPIIGSLRLGDDGKTAGQQLPLSLNLFEIANYARPPHFQLRPANRTCSSASEYCCALADMHLLQLSFQRYDAVDTDDDCRKKYIARQLSRKLARESRLSNPQHDKGPFPLWCDGFSPTNTLLDEDKNLAGVINWQYSYAAPVDFFHCPPWWLLLQAPENWSEEGLLDSWASRYESVLAVFLGALEAKERKLIENGILSSADILSPHMRTSWDSGQFWIVYAATHTWAFDSIYWKYIDERFFGRNESGDFKERLNLLSPEQVEAMEALVVRKRAEEADERLVDWYKDAATETLPPDLLSLPFL